MDLCSAATVVRLDSGAQQGLNTVIPQTEPTLTLYDFTISLQCYAERLHLLHLPFAD